MDIEHNKEVEVSKPNTMLALVTTQGGLPAAALGVVGKASAPREGLTTGPEAREGSVGTGRTE